MSQDAKAPKTLVGIGLSLTAIWVVGLGLFVLLRLDKFAVLEPNAVGDFLAGAFAPLAFLWLVLGFFQQGHELRLQVQELKNSVEHQRQLVEVSREELSLAAEQLGAERERYERERVDAEEALRPRLHVESATRHSTDSGEKVLINIRNLGQPCFDVQVELDAPAACLSLQPVSLPNLKTDQPFQIACFLVPPTKFAGGTLIIHYRNAVFRRGMLKFALNAGETTSVSPIAD
jgi:hypothetical protein